MSPTNLKLYPDIAVVRVAELLLSEVTVYTLLKYTVGNCAYPITPLNRNNRANTHENGIFLKLLIVRSLKTFLKSH